MRIEQTSNSFGTFKKMKAEGSCVDTGTAYASVFDMEYIRQNANAKGELVDYKVKDGDIVDVGDLICYVDDSSERCKGQQVLIT